MKNILWVSENRRSDPSKMNITNIKNAREVSETCQHEISAYRENHSRSQKKESSILFYCTQCVSLSSGPIMREVLEKNIYACTFSPFLMRYKNKENNVISKKISGIIKNKTHFAPSSVVFNNMKMNLEKAANLPKGRLNREYVLSNDILSIEVIKACDESCNKEGLFDFMAFEKVLAEYFTIRSKKTMADNIRTLTQSQTIVSEDDETTIKNALIMLHNKNDLDLEDKPLRELLKITMYNMKRSSFGSVQYSEIVNKIVEYNEPSRDFDFNDFIGRFERVNKIESEIKLIERKNMVKLNFSLRVKERLFINGPFNYNARVSLLNKQDGSDGAIKDKTLDVFCDLNIDSDLDLRNDPPKEKIQK